MGVSNDEKVNLLWRKYNNISDTLRGTAFNQQDYAYYENVFANSILNKNIPTTLTRTQTWETYTETSISVSKLDTYCKDTNKSPGFRVRLDQLNSEYSHLEFVFRKQLAPATDSNSLQSWTAVNPLGGDINNGAENMLRNTIPFSYDKGTENTYNYLLFFSQGAPYTYDWDDGKWNTDTMMTASSYWILDNESGFLFFMGGHDNGPNDITLDYYTNTWINNSKSPPFFSYIRYVGDTGFNNLEMSGNIVIDGSLNINGNLNISDGINISNPITTTDPTLYAFDALNGGIRAAKHISTTSTDQNAFNATDGGISVGKQISTTSTSTNAFNAPDGGINAGKKIRTSSSDENAFEALNGGISVNTANVSGEASINELEVTGNIKRPVFVSNQLYANDAIYLHTLAGWGSPLGQGNLTAGRAGTIIFGVNTYNKTTGSYGNGWDLVKRVYLNTSIVNWTMAQVYIYYTITQNIFGLPYGSGMTYKSLIWNQNQGYGFSENFNIYTNITGEHGPGQNINFQITQVNSLNIGRAWDIWFNNGYNYYGNPTWLSAEIHIIHAPNWSS